MPSAHSSAVIALALNMPSLVADKLLFDFAFEVPGIRGAAANRTLIEEPV